MSGIPERNFPLDKASLVALWVESILYGGYAVLFGICVHILYSRRSPGTPVNLLLLVTAVLMFSMSTIHICIGLARGLTAFIDRTGSPNGASEYYGEIWLWINIFKQALYVTNNIVTDSLVIYRCYVVWSFSYRVVAFPVIMLLATSVCGYVAVAQFAQLVPGQDVFTTTIAEWGTTLFSLSLGTNIIVTSLIAEYTGLEGGPKYSSLGTHNYQNTIAIVLESGIIYSVGLVTLLIVYRSGTNAQYIVYDAMAQIMGIVPTMIIVRVGLGLATQEKNSGAATPSDSSAMGNRLAFNRAAHGKVRMQVQTMQFSSYSGNDFGNV
ncbi:hypothetical protein C8R47DRAFT_1225917 [Mycena vitilis]|nr:hypothetical protein C8R47DRAFT_1225917 [Mycena vitilis]